MILRNNKMILSLLAVLTSIVFSSPVNVTKGSIAELSHWISQPGDEHISNGFEVFNANKECDCGLNSVSCSLNFLDEKVCTCKTDYAARKNLFGGDDICKECDCGPYMTSCSFSKYGFRQCTCESGSVLVGVGDQSCEQCECGDNSFSCSIDSYNGKVCSCMHGYEFRSGDSVCTYYVCFACSNPVNVTNERIAESRAGILLSDEGIVSNGSKVFAADKECDCGPHAVSCRFNVLKDKVCSCEPGYVAKKLMFFGGDDTCKECNCGPDTKSCSFSSLGFRRCDCKPGAVLVEAFRGVGDQRCQWCDCGVQSYSCKINSYDEKICDCYFGFEVKPGDSMCTYREKTTMSNWKIGTIIISIIYSAIIVALILKVACK